MAGGLGAEAPHLPNPAPIDAYGNSGFRFAGMSHRGSLLCFPDGIWAWPVVNVTDLTEDMLAPALARADQLDFLILGVVGDPWVLPARLRERFRAVNLSVDTMTTGPAVRTYNILLAENRRVGAGLIAVP
jgi:uncharacterized protein